MLWIYVLAGTAGVVLLVPTVLRALDGFRSDAITGSLGFGGTTFGACGIALLNVEMGAATRLLAAAALGLAASAIHPEVLSALRRRSGAES